MIITKLCREFKFCWYFYHSRRATISSSTRLYDQQQNVLFVKARIRIIIIITGIASLNPKPTLVYCFVVEHNVENSLEIFLRFSGLILQNLRHITVTPILTNCLKLDGEFFTFVSYISSGQFPL